MADLIERLGLGTEVRELKLGASFTNDRSSAFHTVKYDFKPASVDESKVATVDVGTNNTMTVTVPNLDGSGNPHTVFKGSQKPCLKECVLIIDHETGEITLERLSSNIQVKKTRLTNGNNARPATPSEMKKSPPGPSKASPRPEVAPYKKSPPEEPVRSPPHSRTNSRTKVVSGKKKEPSFEVPGKKPPGRFSPHLASNKKRESPTFSNGNNNSPPMPAVPGSLPMLGMDDDFGLIPLTQAPPVAPVAQKQSIPVKQSSMPVKPQNLKPIQKPSPSSLTDTSSSSSSSSSDSSDSSDNESDHTAKQTLPKTTNARILMMPNLLNDDLQLSESESD